MVLATGYRGRHLEHNLSIPRTSHTKQVLTGFGINLVRHQKIAFVLHGIAITALHFHRSDRSRGACSRELSHTIQTGINQIYLEPCRMIRVYIPWFTAIGFEQSSPSAAAATSTGVPIAITFVPANHIQAAAIVSKLLLIIVLFYMNTILKNTLIKP